VILGLLLLAVATVLLVVGAELFVRNAAATAARLGITVVAVGVLLAGAEPEELVTAVLASWRGKPDLAVGDAIGANVALLLLVLGLAAVVRPVPFAGRVRHYAAMAAGAGGLAALVLAGGQVTRLEGLLLLAAYAGVVAFVWWREKAPPAIGELTEIEEVGELMSGARRDRVLLRTPTGSVVVAIVGLWALLIGGSVAVDATTRVASALDLTDTGIGLTLLALATSAEMFVIVVAAKRHDVPGIAIAGVVGSAAYNATVTLGAAALVRPLHVPGLAVHALFAAVLPLALLGLARDGWLGRRAGVMLCLGYAAYLAVVLISAAMAA
jgi:cation:H+ antiporter